MDKLLEARNKIDEIDFQLIKLFEKRMDIVKDVINYKIENNMAILDSNRETKMLEKHLSIINNIEYKQYYKHVINGYLTASKQMQKDIVNKNSL